MTDGTTASATGFVAAETATVGTTVATLAGFTVVAAVVAVVVANGVTGPDV